MEEDESYVMLSPTEEGIVKHDLKKRQDQKPWPTFGDFIPFPGIRS